ncbi:hypothetical protein L249_1157 [Ophiocordyceps polyrhachis-furcata BCC 54312]|uniref:Uncharacterized protein n=1 Tax=Ophiocordyceps polyrhachis-furcata BCC 54312 TaxID=1330021 RepID=A0A367LFG6_9HYPO|nr:hypothetical protein L249_1157 [Ophiocordyceps polyrhachis-furcata BCC 54312]
MPQKADKGRAGQSFYSKKRLFHLNPNPNTVYFFGIHLFGAVFLACWIRLADAKYRAYLDSLGVNSTWWAFYSSQSAVDNLGFTLTPDSMGHFRDASLPLLLLGALGLAGQTLRPVFLRLSLWLCAKVPGRAERAESASYLLENPQACLSMFPAVATRAQLIIISALTFGETVFITVNDGHGVEVAGLSLGQRLSAAFFQAAAARHAGMTPYNLANVSAAAQLSLLVMMFIATCPIVTAEYDNSAILASTTSPTYLARLVREQLGLDVWWFFLAVFCLTISEARSVQDDPVEGRAKQTNKKKKGLSDFPLMFEVVTAYNNVGISLGHPDVDAALCAKFSVVGKLVLCVLMVRGRHRRMLHRFRLLPDRYLLRLEEEEKEEEEEEEEAIGGSSC